MKNILVTGAYGQLGNEIRILSANYPQYNFMFTDVDSLDITDKSELIDFVTGNDIRYIINCAAYTAVDKAEDETQLCEKINATAVKNLGIAAAEAGAGIVHVSTDYVFDGSSCTLKFSTRPSPTSCLLSKLKLAVSAVPLIRFLWKYALSVSRLSVCVGSEPTPETAVRTPWQSVWLLKSWTQSTIWAEPLRRRKKPIEWQRLTRLSHTTDINV